MSRENQRIGADLTVDAVGRDLAFHAGRRLAAGDDIARWRNHGARLGVTEADMAVR